MFILRPSIRMGFVVCAFVALNSIGYTYANEVKVNNSRDDGQETRYMKEDREAYNNDESTTNYHFEGIPVLSNDFATKEMARQLANDSGSDYKRMRPHKVDYEQYSAAMMGRTAAKSTKAPSTTSGKSSKSSAQPSEHPSISSVPTVSSSPSISAQPSEHPSISSVPSEYPSENPSTTDVPSFEPSISSEPSEVPSISGKPSVSSEPSRSPSASKSSKNSKSR